MKHKRRNLILTTLVGGIALLTLTACTNWPGLQRWVPGWANTNEQEDVTRKDVTRFVKSTRQAKGNAKTHYQLASYYVERDRINDAIEEFKKAILIDRTHVKAYNGLGVCYDRLGFHKDAQQYYRAALQVNPKLDYLHNNLGYSYILEGAYEDAIDILERAIAHDFGGPAIYNNLGLAYARTDRYELALEAFLSAGDQGAAHHNMAVEYEEAGMNEKAWEHYEIAEAIELGKRVAEEPRAAHSVVEADVRVTEPAEVFAQPVMVDHSEIPAIIETDLAEPEPIEENSGSNEPAAAPAAADVTTFGVVAAPAVPSAEDPEIREIIEPEVEEEAPQAEILPDQIEKDDHAAAAFAPVSPAAEPAMVEDLAASVPEEEVIEAETKETAVVEYVMPAALEETTPENRPDSPEIAVIPAVVTVAAQVNGAEHKIEETVVILDAQPVITNKAVVVSDSRKPAEGPLLASLDPIVPMVEHLTQAGLSDEVLDSLAESAAIQVSNGCGVRNIAHTVQDYLRQRGFHVVIADDADHHDYPRTMVYYIDPHLHDAFDVAQQIPLWQDMDEVAALRKKDVAIRILLGKDMRRFMPYFKEGVSQ